jgi:hypothetical protein
VTGNRSDEAFEALGISDPSRDPDLDDGYEPLIEAGHRADPAGENLIEAFIETFNARDLPGLAELLSGEATAELEGETTAVLDTLDEMFIREPSLVATRGELGTEPVVGLWRPTDGRYLQIGYLTFTISVDSEPLIERIDLVDDLEDETLLMETPDSVEIAEWERAEDESGVEGGEHL